VRELRLACGMTAFLDDEDFVRADSFGLWRAVKGSNTYYARIKKRYAIVLHHFILGIGKGDLGKQVIDHIDGNGLNCQKLNLRIASRSLNAFNTFTLRPNNRSGHTGVMCNKAGKWEAYVYQNRKQIHLGYFSSIEEAIEARRKKSQEILGNALYVPLASKSRPEWENLDTNRNTSGVVGVYWDRRYDRWSFDRQIGKKRYTGVGFATVAEAAEALKHIQQGP